MSQSTANAAWYFVDRHLNDRAAKPAFIESRPGGRTLTYAGLAERSDRMAALYEHHGVRREERAVMIVLDTADFPVIFWGSLKAGVVPIPLNTLLAGDIYGAILRDSRAPILFVSRELLPTVQPILAGQPFLKTVIVVGGDAPEGMAGFESELMASVPRPMIDVIADETAFWLYSSGSTGRPKGVRHVHGSLQATSETYGAKVLGIRQDDLVYSVAKMFFAYGLGNAMTFPLSVGATTVLLADRPTPDSVFDIMKRFNPTVFCGVPTLYAAMVAAMKDGAPDGFKRLRTAISAGEALPAEVGNRWKALTGCDILDGVGSTEMLHIFLSNAPGSIVYGTSGTAVPGYELRLVDDKDEDVGPGGIGELLVNGPSSASDYWNQRDKYELRDDGRLVYCGRTDDMFKVSGIWLSPFEVEQALITHPAVLEAAVVAARDEEGLEKPKAFVVLKEAGADAATLQEQLKDHVKERIGKWKYPRWVEIVEELPKTATGKIQRFKLR